MKTISIIPLKNFRKDTILIGANCLDKRIVKQAINDGLQIVNPYRSYDEILKASETCWNISLNYCNYLGEVLNDIQGVSYSMSYWKVLLLPWLISFVENLYDRYLRLCLIRKDFPEAAIEIPKVEVSAPLYARSFDVWGNSHLHSTNIKMYTFLIEHMGLNSNVRYLDAISEEPIRPTLFLRLIRILKRFYRSLYFSLGDNLFLWYAEKPRDIFGLSRELGGLQWGVPYLKEEGFSKNALNREKIIFNQTSNEFEGFLNKIIPKALPVSLFEEFRERRNMASAFINKKRIKTIFSSEYLWLNDTEKFVLAEIKNNGGKIIGRQHGGTYGCLMINLHELVERSICDYFITWGWSDKKSCPTVPLPVPYLSGKTNSQTRKRNKILFIGSHAPMYMYNYQDYWMPEFVCSKYYFMKKVFFENLNGSLKKMLLYRPYPHEYGWNEKEEIRKMLPDVNFLIKKPAIIGMKTCSIVIIDHPSTSFLEALQINVPTIIFWDNNQSPMRDEAQLYFQLLHESGILYYDPLAAAKKANEIADDPQDWWKSQKVQIARQKFCRRYVWADENWKDIWSRAIKIIE